MPVGHAPVTAPADPDIPPGGGASPCPPTSPRRPRRALGRWTSWSTTPGRPGHCPWSRGRSGGLAVNLKPAFLLTRAVPPGMRAHQGEDYWEPPPDQDGEGPGWRSWPYQGVTPRALRRMPGGR
jgi:hypothetical protein